MNNDLLTDLNPEQRTAVTHGSGPLLIVAGAGTGKTLVLSRRIAWLIQTGQVTAGEILALTFTDKAAGEMETRVDQLLAYGETGVTIATFHSFGDQILREHALDCGLPPEFRVMSEAEQLHFLAERFDGLEGLRELQPTNQPRKYLEAILRVINRAKDELVDPAAYQQAALTLKVQAATDEDRRAARRQQEIATIYRAYEAMKAEAGLIDFGDQITLVTQLLTDQPAIRERLRERFRFLLIDEFQDTNIAQYRLATMLLGNDQNLTVVGDDDQAIYKFRGAAVSNILGFLKDFPTATSVVLTQNYRSAQTILDSAYQLIRHNDPDRLESTLAITKRLISQQPPGSAPVFDWYAHETDELAGLVDRIKRIKNQDHWREMAILVRSNSQISSIASALTQGSIPYRTSSDRDFPNLPEIRGAVAFLRVLARPNDSVSFVKLAFSPYFRLEPSWILQLNDLARKTRREIADLLGNENSELWQRLPEAGRAALREFRDSLIRYRALLRNKTIGEILYQFLKDRGILTIDQPGQKGNQLSLFAEQPEEERLLMIHNLAALFESIKGFLAVSRDRFALTTIDQLDDLLAAVVPPQTDLGPEIDAVQILTVHAAKGLEFETVLLPGLTSDRFPARRRTDPLTLPDSLIQETLPTGDEHLEEERRLFYVALTRAKRRLILSGAARTGRGVRLKKLSPFVQEALGLTEPATTIERGSQASRLQLFAPHLPAPVSLTFPNIDGTLFLTPAMIETYHDDPYQFYWRYVLKAPQPASRALIYGTAIHAAIEAYYRQRQADQPVTLDDLSQRYRSAWRSEGFDSVADEQRQLAAGEQTLARFLKRADQEPLPDFVEEEFILHLPGVRLKGRIDALYPQSGEIRDFKTSQVADQKEADERAHHNLPIRIYALAYQRRFGELPKSLVLDFVEKDLTGTFVPTDQLLEETKQLIADVVRGIKANHFESNPNNPFKDYV